MTRDEPLPLVSLALPLYKSRRFLDIILENLDGLDYPHLEILVSDRHGADNTLELLQARYCNDARFRFFRADDKINWVEHYNFLLRVAAGKYFFWMPHDDSFPPAFVRLLVSELERHPDALGAFGGMRALYFDGSTRMFPEHLPFANAAPWTLLTAFQIYLNNSLWLPFHGLMRREALVQKNLFLLSTRDTYAADVVWDFAAVLSGRFIYVPECSYLKRYYPTSTHALWKPPTWQHALAEVAALRAYLIRPGVSFRSHLRAWVCILFWFSLRSGKGLLTRLRLFQFLHAPVRNLMLFALRLADRTRR